MGADLNDPLCRPQANTIPHPPSPIPHPPSPIPHPIPSSPHLAVDPGLEAGAELVFGDPPALFDVDAG